MKRFFITFAILGFGVCDSANSTPLSGTKTIGPTGDYASIGAAIADIQTQTLGGALVLELQAAYVSSTETFPLVFSNLTTTASNTLTLRPQTGATGLSITSANTTAATVDLNGAQFVTIDGRPGGAGTTKELIIENTSTYGVALRFIDEASSNTIRHTVFRGVNASAYSGVVVFSTTTGANGNDNNLIEYCDIRDGATTPANGIYALGTSPTAKNNSGNTVSNCNIFNFYSARDPAAGVQLDGGNTDWTITGSSFYQTTSRTGVTTGVAAIHVNNSAGNNFTVAGNFIGGSAPGAGGTAWTSTSVTGVRSAPYFVGIHLFVGSTMPSSLQGNFIQNMIWTGQNVSGIDFGMWNGIVVSAGAAVNIGTVTGNTIGSGSGTSSISVTTSSTGGMTFGIWSSGLSSVRIDNNTIGSITVNGSTTGISASLTGIQATGGASTISNNLVGSTTTANSLNAATSSTSGTGQQVTGILRSNSSLSITNITGNTVSNLNNNYTGTSSSGRVCGIVTSGGWNNIIGNTVCNLSTTSQNTSTASTQSVCGISATGPAVTGNLVHSLANTTASEGVTVTGIYVTEGSPSYEIYRVTENLVHSLAVSSSSPSSVANGMQLNVTSAARTVIAQNNMVRLGIDAGGASTAGASIVRGILDNATASVRNFYHNTVYVGGAQTSGASGTFAFQSTGVSNTRNFQNNLFVNARGNSGGTGKHYAVNYGGTTGNPAGLTAGGNIFHAPNTANGGVLGFFNSADRPTLAAWQAATGQDATSAVADPLFVDATGNATAVDLHLQPSNPAEGGALPIAAVTIDFDDETRSALTPTDIGADAGNFTVSTDLFAPTISHPLLTNSTTANRVLTGWATITDAVGVASGANAPRLYFKKSTDADAFVGNTAADNGWKHVTASNGTSPISFTIDYSLINGGSVGLGDVIQYFVVAQDAANNLGSSPLGATSSANPPVQNVSGHGAVNSFTIVPIFSGGTVTVGSGGTYPSLSGAGGLFAALNGAVLTGNFVVNVTSDVTEDGSVKLNEFNAIEYPATVSYTLAIQPDSATMRTISGSAASGLVTLNGADHVTIDGRFGGSGRYLTFRNTSNGSTASTILFINDASNNTVRNCIVEGAESGFHGVIVLSTGAVTGNDSNLVTGCQIRDLSTSAGVPTTLIRSSGSSAAVANSSNTVSNNELFNFSGYGIVISTTSDSWTLTGNNIYNVSASTGSPIGIYMGCRGTNVITGNVIHDLLTTGTVSYAILFTGTSTTTIARNHISALNVNAATTNVYGIHASGSASSTLNVVNNQVTLSPAAPISTTLCGLYDTGASSSVVNAFYNSIVLGGTESGTRSSWASFRDSASTHTARDNIFLNLRVGGSGSHFAAGSEITGGSYTASNNVYAGTGATAASFMDFSGTAGTAVPMSFASWQSTTGDTASQAGQAGSGGFTSAMFTNAATGDLHLVPSGNPLVNNTGIPIAGVMDDYDGDARSASTPFIGSDELVLPNIVVSQTGALTDGIGGVDFGTVNVSSSSGAMTFTITNSGTADLTGLAVSKAGANPEDFAVSALSSTSVAVGAGSATFTVTFAPGAGGTRTAAIHIASNVTGAKNPFDIALSGTGLITQEMWRQTWFGTTANSGDAADRFDYDHDGLVNLVEFAFGMNPTQNSAGQLPSGQIIGGSFVISFTQPAGVSGITYGAEWSTTLTGTWNPIADTGTPPQHTFSVPIGGNTNLFVRLKVTVP